REPRWRTPYPRWWREGPTSATEALCEARSAEEDLGLLVALGRNGLEGVGGLGQVDPDDLGALQGHHASERLLVHGLDGVNAQTGGEDTVEGAGGAAALHVAQDHRAGLLAGALLDLLGEGLADAAQTHVAEGVLLAGRQFHLPLLGVGALGDDDDRCVLGLEAALDVLDDLVDVERALR